MSDSDTDDFTFCKVDSEAVNDHVESPKAIPDVNKIILKEHFSDDKNINKSYDSFQDKGSNGESLPRIEGQKLELRKPIVRAKVPFEKGYSQMDWLKLTRTHPDLAGLRGQTNKRLITMDDVKKHKSEGSIWTVLKGRVYNISPYMKFHPGGVDMLSMAAGKDCTSLFNKYHAWVNAEFLLEKCLVGVLNYDP